MYFQAEVWSYVKEKKMGEYERRMPYSEINYVSLSVCLSVCLSCVDTVCVNTSGPPWNLSYTFLFLHVFCVHSGAAKHVDPSGLIHHKFFQHMSIVHSCDWTIFSFDQFGSIVTVYDRHVLEKLVVNQMWCGNRMLKTCTKRSV